MVIDDLHTQSGHQPIEPPGGIPFKAGIGVSAAADTIDDITAIFVFGNEAFDRVYVILKIRVEADGRVCVVFGEKETGEERVLMPPVTAETETGKAMVMTVQGGDQVPGPVRGAVIDKENAAFLGYAAAGGQFTEDIQQTLGCFRKNSLFIVAWNDEI